MRGEKASPFFEESGDKKEIMIRELTLRNGISFPSNEELIMLILGSGTKAMPIRELARHVLSIVLSSNEENLVENLIKIKGMGKTKALKIAAALEIGKRVSKSPQVSFDSPKNLIPFIQSYAMQPQELFLCISLTGALDVISIRVICQGSGNMAIVRPAEVFSQAIKENASAIVICHNHPSGNPTPSKEDIRTTLRLFLAAETLGISLADHIIITRSRYFSFIEHGFMNEERLLTLLGKS